jgi:hypothetical protein
LWVAAYRTWWERHSFTSSVVSSLLVLGVTALIFDEVVARRQRRERAVSVAVQGLIVYGQARRTYDAIIAVPRRGEGAAQANGAPEELRSLANMLLVASPALFDDPEARLFLESVQRLAGSMYRASSAATIPSLTGPRLGPDSLDRLRAERSQVDERIKPLAARVPSQDRASFAEQPDLAAPKR